MTVPCEAVLCYLPAYLDDEATPLGIEEIAHHLAGCEPCRAAAMHDISYRHAIAAAHRRVPAPQGVRESISRAVRSGAGRPGVGRLAPLLALVLVAGAVLALLARGATSPRASLGEVAAHHHDAFLRGLAPLDIATSDPARLVTWLEGRLPFALNLPRVEDPELRLVGARLVQVGDEFGAFLVYRQGRANVSLALARARGAVELPGAESETFRSLRFHLKQLRGHNVISWNDRGLAYALVSDSPAQGRASCTVCHAPGSGLRDVEEFHR